MFFERKRKRFSVKVEGIEGRVNFFKNMFDVGFPVKSGSYPESEIFDKVHMRKRIVIYYDRWKVANSQDI